MSKRIAYEPQTGKIRGFYSPFRENIPHNNIEVSDEIFAELKDRLNHRGKTCTVNRAAMGIEGEQTVFNEIFTTVDTPPNPPLPVPWQDLIDEVAALRKRIEELESK